MSKVKEKAQGVTKQVVGEMIGDDLLVREGKEQQRKAGHESDSPDAAPGREPGTPKRRDV